MQIIKKIIYSALLIILLPEAISMGQDKKTEQKIKIVVADDRGSKVVLDTLITGKPSADSIVLKDGRTLYLVDEKNDPHGDKVSKTYTITTSSDGDDNDRQVKKQITIVGNESGIPEAQKKGKCKQSACETLVSETITNGSDKMDSNTEKAKYVINRDGMVITVEGSDYEKVKKLITEIEKSLDTNADSR